MMDHTWFWAGLWRLSEWTGVGLGRFAPYVFGKMIGATAQREATDDQ